MPESNQKKVQIIETAKSLFWKFGLRRVSVEEICREANVSKMTFYKFFKNKIQLVKCILDNIEKDATTKYRNIMDQEIPFHEKVIQTINLKMDQVDDLSAEFYSDLHQSALPEIAEYFKNITDRSIQLIVDDYTLAQQKGEIRKDLNIEFVIYQLKNLIAMANDPNLIKMYKSPQDLIMELTRFFFYGILPRELYDN